MVNTADPGPGQSRTTILVVDDEPALVALVRTMLWRAGYNILEAGSGEEALRIAAEEQGLIKLLLTDVLMPEMNGYELAAKLRKSRPEMKVLFMSGYRDRAIFESTGVAVEDYPLVRKPFTQFALVSRIAEVLESAQVQA
ncbi:MAG TPA: response regulator [Bryobacteraceae bacterium]|nr:response regulator [Bryobacteraceae bacterium]